MEAEKGSPVIFYIIYIHICVFSLFRSAWLEEEGTWLRSDPLAEGLLRGSQQKWKPFRKEVTCCLRTRGRPPCKGCGRPAARPGCGNGHGGRPPALPLSPRAGAGLVLMPGRFPSRDWSARTNGSLQSLRCGASGSTPLPGASRPQGDARQACARAPCVAQRVPARGSPAPQLFLAVLGANGQQTHTGISGWVPRARLLSARRYPWDGSNCARAAASPHGERLGLVRSRVIWEPQFPGHG